MISCENTKTWIKEGPTLEIINEVDKTGKELADRHKGISKSQIRNIFSKLKEIEVKGFQNKKADFLMLKPLAAYSSKRSDKKIFEDLRKNLIEPAIEEVLNAPNEEEAFNNFVLLFEAVLAYHKAHGGK